MTVFNKSIYTFAKNDNARKIFYEKMINKCYFEPIISIIDTKNTTNISVSSCANCDFYLMMKKFHKNNKNNDIYEKYKENIISVSNFIDSFIDYNYDLAINKKFTQMFESNEDMLNSLCFVDKITKYFNYGENDYIFGVGKYSLKEKKLEGVFLFSCSKENISNCAYYPLFDIDDGFMDPFGDKKKVANLNKYFEIWKKNNYEGEIFY